ncbi:MAG: cytochrome C oxidase subunit IV family protein [Candidatus Rokubacteria bacterium]|nr:cytochrome C oxidase subunit IV family protein [Candidatus Rokubacteria bacterium]
MATAAHKHPNYMAVFWWLAILTVVEIGVVFLPIGKILIAVLLCAFAVAKAALVAAYFMHLKFETRTMTWIAVTPVAIAILLILVIMPDSFAVSKKTTGSGKAAATAPAEQK